MLFFSCVNVSVILDLWLCFKVPGELEDRFKKKWVAATT